MSTNDPVNLYAPLRGTDELPGHVITEELAELHKAPRVCIGLSCNQSRKPCTEGCPKREEMACTAGADPYPGVWRALWALLSGSKPY